MSKSLNSITPSSAHSTTSLKLSTLHPRFALAALAFLVRVGTPYAVDVVEDTPTCYDQADNRSPLATSLASFAFNGGSWLDYNALRYIVESVGDLVPGFSQCAANTNAMSIFQIIATSQTLRSCGNTLSQFTIPSELPDGNFFRYSLCPLCKDTIVPCINEGVVKELLVATMDRTGECCNEFKDTIASAFGADLATTVDALLKLVGSSMCSVKTFRLEKFGRAVEQTCGYSIVSALNTSNDKASGNLLLNALQIKHGEVRSTVNGREFHISSGETTVLKSSGVHGLALWNDEFLSDTLSFGSSSEDFDSFTSDTDGTDDGVADLTGGKDNDFLKTVFPDRLLHACYHVPHNLSCHCGNETIQLMCPEAIFSTPMATVAPAAAPSMATAQRLRQ
ncbi:hypothetical protein FI667_g10647, partial [Globisporangium splendens]